MTEDATRTSCQGCGIEQDKTHEKKLGKYPGTKMDDKLYLCRICAQTTIGNVALREAVGMYRDGDEILKAIGQVANLIIMEIRKAGHGD